MSKDNVSPKVSVPFVIGLVLVILQAIATNSWNAGEWYTSVSVVLLAIVGYLKTDPARVA